MASGYTPAALTCSAARDLGQSSPEGLRFLLKKVGSIGTEIGFALVAVMFQSSFRFAERWRDTLFPCTPPGCLSKVLGWKPLLQLTSDVDTF